MPEAGWEKLTSSKTFFNPFWVKAEHSTYLKQSIVSINLQYGSVKLGEEESMTEKIVLRNMKYRILIRGGGSNILHGRQVFGELFTLLVADWCLALLGKLLNYGCVIPKIDLGSDNQAWDSGAMMPNLGQPFLLDDRIQISESHQKISRTVEGLTLTFSKLAGELTLKQIKNTSVWG